MIDNFLYRNVEGCALCLNDKFTRMFIDYECKKKNSATYIQHKKTIRICAELVMWLLFLWMGS